MVICIHIFMKYISLSLYIYINIYIYIIISKLHLRYASHWRSHLGPSFDEKSGNPGRTRGGDFEESSPEIGTSNIETGEAPINDSILSKQKDLNKTDWDLHS